MVRFSAIAACFLVANPSTAQSPFVLPRCESIPLPKNRVAMTIDGVARTFWHFDQDYPRPFFYPLNGPAGSSLTRMGHPGAENHDHHRSIWFAHEKVAGVNFWSDTSRARVKQKHWYAYEDGTDETVMAAVLGWYDESGQELMEQDVVAALAPQGQHEYLLELQLMLRPPKGVKDVELGQTNFGFLAVRVAKTLSEHFGGGRLTNSEGQQSESNIFGNQARWVDYSGPIAAGRGPDRTVVTEGITFFDHPSNPRYPTFWHVREDGWMGASFNMKRAYTVESSKGLTLRYLLFVHQGPANAKRSEAVLSAFSRRAAFRVTKSTRKHRQYDVKRTKK